MAGIRKTPVPKYGGFWSAILPVKAYRRVISTLFPSTPPSTAPATPPTTAPLSLSRLVTAPIAAPAAAPIAASRFVCLTTVVLRAGAEYVPEERPDELEDR